MLLLCIYTSKWLSVLNFMLIQVNDSSDFNKKFVTSHLFNPLKKYFSTIINN